MGGWDQVVPNFYKSMILCHIWYFCRKCLVNSRQMSQIYVFFLWSHHPEFRNKFPQKSFSPSVILHLNWNSSKDIMSPLVVFTSVLVNQAKSSNAIHRCAILYLACSCKMWPFNCFLHVMNRLGRLWIACLPIHKYSLIRERQCYLVKHT